MTRLRVSAAIDAPPERVWDVVRDIAGHVDWMEDAEAIRFTSETTSGVGTTYECDTRVGPLHLVDRMEITEWSEGEAMGISHQGVVRGRGRFRLLPRARGGTRFVWEEDLGFPWWMGGPLGAVVGGRVLSRIWARNLERLKARVEGTA